MHKINENKNKGFSLIELIVVIAIMAVLVALLAPSLLSYVERSRAQKDDSAMGEVTNAVLLAMSDQDVYDEVVLYTFHGNVSCYISDEAEPTAADGKITLTDPAGESIEAAQIITKAAQGTTWLAQYYYDDNARLVDEVEYTAVGNMRGVTITFFPEGDGNKKYYDLENAMVNAFIGGNTAVLIDQEAADDATKTINGDAKANFVNLKLSALGHDDAARGQYLYKSVMATVGKRIDLSSQTYRNSEYTVFIRMGTTGADASSASGISVYGQWNGTNLVYNSDGFDTTTP